MCRGLTEIAPNHLDLAGKASGVGGLVRARTGAPAPTSWETTCRPTIVPVAPATRILL